MNKTEVTKIVKDEIDKFVSNSLDKEVKNIIKKGGTQTRDETLKTISDVIEAMYKVLWQKKQFWKTDIK